MAELRKDYFLDRYVIFATERAKRPDQLKQETPKTGDKKCFFCPGSEHLTPPEIDRREDENGWYIRVFPNKFPAVSGGENLELTTHNDYFTFADAVGHHEVIVETPSHSESLWDLDEDRVLELLQVYKERIVELNNDHKTKYVAVFKNHGKQAGASLQHSHTQIISYNLIPQEIQEKEKACKDGCPYCDIIGAEEDSERVVFRDENLVCFTPYASRFLFEVWLLPRRHVIRFEELKQEELASISRGLLKVTKKLKELNAPYNFYICYGLNNMHLHIEVAPRLAKWAGFEYATGTIVNPVLPEKAAAFYRDEAE